MKIEALVEQAYQEVMDQSLRPQDKAHVVTVCTRFLAAYTAQQEPVKYLCKGARFKTYLTTDRGVVLEGLPRELAGIWVAMVEATNDCHLRHAAPVVPADMVLVRREPTNAMLSEAFKVTRYNEGIGSGADLYKAMIAAGEVKP